MGNMWKRIFATKTGSKTELSNKLSSIDKPAINRALKERALEIESLRRYDRGEKTIDAPDLTHLVRSVR
jgi:hypothetical protein